MATLDQRLGKAAPRASGRPVPGGGSVAPRWPGYAAAAAAFLFAGVSLYWGLGGTAGVSSLGGRIEELAVARDRTLMAFVWASVVVKGAIGVLALALVQPWGRRLPRCRLLPAAWTAAALLTLYGVLQETSVVLVKFGVIETPEPRDSSALLWRLLVWEPWFLVWGVLLGLAAHHARRRPSQA